MEAFGQTSGQAGGQAGGQARRQSGGQAGKTKCRQAGFYMAPAPEASDLNLSWEKDRQPWLTQIPRNVLEILVN